MGPGESDQRASGQTFHQLHARIRERVHGEAAAGGQPTGEAVEEAAGNSGQRAAYVEGSAGRQDYERNKRRDQLGADQGKEIPLLTEIVKRQNEMLFLEQELEELPAKLPYDQAHGGRKLEKLNYEKKRFLDCIKLYGYNTRKRMCEMLLEYYDKEKEVLPALSMIVERGGYVKLVGDRLRVQLRRFKNLEIDYADRGLCEDLNAMNPTTLDKYRLPIWFSVS
jgi:hypothetical protein